MLDSKPIEQLNRGYVCPPNAGPAWRSACEYGFDMSLVERAIEMTPQERIEEHQHALNPVLEVESARKQHEQTHSGSRLGSSGLSRRKLSSAAIPAQGND